MKLKSGFVFAIGMLLASYGLVACGDDKKDNDTNVEEQKHENTATLCQDTQDNDEDGKVDCDDEECREFAFCQEAEPNKENTLATCQDEEDNDGDGKFDCDDEDCKVFMACGATVISEPENTEERCKDKKDNDGDSKIDCDDPDCASFCGSSGDPKENTDALCHDEADNDGDGQTDCDDPDCASFCGSSGDPKENTNALCHDEADNDGDGQTDCDDPDCATFCGGDPNGPKEDSEEACQNNQDDDGDGKKDCADPDCQIYEFCNFGGATGENTPEKCLNGNDDDGDGYADCDDPECQDFRFCNREKYTDPKDIACIKAFDEEGADCTSEKCDGAPICQNVVCSLADDPYKYEEGSCICGMSVSQLLVDAGESTVCAVNIDNSNFMHYVSPYGETPTTTNYLPSPIILKQDIYLGTKQDWTGLNGNNSGNTKRWEYGVLDGNGKKIIGNLTCHKNITECGLFQRVQDTVIANVDLRYTLRGYRLVGGIAGVSRESTFKNIRSASKVFASYDETAQAALSDGEEYAAIAGGLVGHAVYEDKFIDIEMTGAAATAENTVTDSYAAAGGVIGIANTMDIQNVSSTTAVTSNYNITTTQYVRSCAGGILGLALSSGKIDKATVNASIMSKSKGSKISVAAGGIVGCVTCVGSINPTDCVQGGTNPVKVIEKPAILTMTDVQSYGQITAQNSADAQAWVYAGGIAGTLKQKSEQDGGSTISGAYSEANITCSAGESSLPLEDDKHGNCNVGGILGEGEQTIIRSVSYRGNMDIDAIYQIIAGGVVGMLKNGSVANASASGNIQFNEPCASEAKLMAGGIIGNSDHCTTVNTYNNTIMGRQHAADDTCTGLAINMGAVVGKGTGGYLYEDYWTPSTLPAALNIGVPQIAGSTSDIHVDATCHKFGDTADHIIENEANKPNLFDHLRYNLGVTAVGGVASVNLPYANDYRTWKLITDSESMSWPVVDLDSAMRLEAGSNN